MRFLSHPNLPAGKVELCALASGQAYITRALTDLGIQVLPVEPVQSLPDPIARHPDLQLHHLGGEQILVAGENEALAQALADQGFTVIRCTQNLSDTYPGDALLCCFPLGDRLYCAPKATATQLLSRHRLVQPVRQGYARCATCIVSENAIITADCGIADAAVRSGLAVLRIRPGHIALPGYDHGFIGGCCGLIARDVLAFTGDLLSHPDGRVIREFCREQGVEVLCLGGGPLLDIGCILPLAEEG